MKPNRYCIAGGKIDGKPLSDEDVDKIAQIIKLSLGVSDIESE